MVDEGLRRAIALSDLPVGLIDLDSLTILACSARAAAMLGSTQDDLLGSPVLELTEEAEATRDALEVMARGAIDAYEASRRIRRRDGSSSQARLWVRDLRPQGYPGQALLFVVPEGESRDGTEVARIAPAHPQVTVGTADDAGVVDRLSPEIRELLGYANGDLQGGRLIDSVHHQDAQRLEDAIERSLTDRCAVGVTVRFANQDNSWDGVRMVISPADGTTSDRLGFSLTDEVMTLGQFGSDPRSATSQADLDAGLDLMANEIQAMRVAVDLAELPTGRRVPELADLSSRQWEIVTRLLAGQRPPAIAKAMFLSQSTVRNHLSAVYQKLGVHSQQELIDLLQGRSDDLPVPV